MQVDGVEEEVPGELENICSDDGELPKPSERFTDCHTLMTRMALLLFLDSLTL